MDTIVHMIFVMILLPVKFANVWPLDSTFNFCGVCSTQMLLLQLMQMVIIKDVD